MHFFNIDAVAVKLKQQRMFTLEKVFYFIGMVTLIILRLGVFNLLPTLYFETFNYIKTYLEYEARSANLKIDVITTIPTWFIFSQLIIIFVGIFGCYAANKRGDGKQFIERFVCLSWPAMIRIMFISTLFFAIIMVVRGNTFLTELAALTKKSTNGIPIFRFFVKAVKHLNVLKTIDDNLTKLARAKVIFARLSQFSIRMYTVCHAVSLLGTMWYFRSIRKRMRFIGRK